MNYKFRFEEGRDSEARLQKVLSYDYEKSEYYGQVRKGFEKEQMKVAKTNQGIPLTSSFRVYRIKPSVTVSVNQGCNSIDIFFVPESESVMFGVLRHV